MSDEERSTFVGMPNSISGAIIWLALMALVYFSLQYAFSVILTVMA